MINKIFIFYTCIILFILLIFNACEKKPADPIYNNNYDPLSENGDNIPPTIFLEVNLDSGITNETEFIFDAGKSFENDMNELDLFYKWDLRPWSKEDTLWTKEPKRTQIFNIGGGDHQIKLSVRGLKSLSSDTIFSVFVNTRPLASFYAIEDYSDYQLYHFDASASTDYEDSKNLQYRWDFEDDGVWDTPL